MNDMEAELLPRLFSVDEYHRMAEGGLFDDERVELLDGVVVTMAPLGMPHWSRHRTVFLYLHAALGNRAQVHGSISLPLGDRSEPEPDLAVLANLPYEARGRTPEPSEILAVVELSYSSIVKDLKAKRLLYARFEIADYLVADLEKNVLHHCSEPRSGDYSLTRILRAGETFELASAPGTVLSSDPFFPQQVPEAAT